jgi:hypothetical protein
LDQLRAWNVDLLQRMMSDQRYRRHSMTNPNASLAHSNAGARRSISNSSSNIINNSTSAATSVSNRLNHLHRAQSQARNEMSLNSLLVAPRTEMLAKQKLGTPDLSSTNSLPGAGVGSVDGNDGSFSNSMPSSANDIPSNTNNMPYTAGTVLWVQKTG